MSREFKLAPATVKKILNQSGALPDAGGCYSTEQVTACLYGDLRAERLQIFGYLRRFHSLVHI